MKSRVYLTPACPLCGWAMPAIVFMNQRAVYCYNEECSNFGIAFVAPSVELEILGRVTTGIDDDAD